MRRKSGAEYFDNTPFRERFLQLERRDGLTLADIAGRIGWEHKDKAGRMKPDSSRVARMLGIVADGPKGKKRQEISYDNAVTLCDALHLEYTDMGV